MWNQWNPKRMEEAIICVRTKKLGYTRAANMFKVPRTTLRRLVASDLPPEDCVNMRLGRKPVIPPEMEAQLVDYLLEMENQFYGLTRNDVKKMAYQLAIRNKLKHPFGRNEKAGRAWFDQFIRRHPTLTIHSTSSRVAGFNKEFMSAFYNILENIYKKHNYNPDRIFNVDETGFSIVQSEIPHIICLKGKKEVDLLTAVERSSLITVIYCMSAGGTFVPPMLIFPCKNMSNILMKGAPIGSIGTCHPSGWVQTHLFTEWFQHFIKKINPTKESPVLLILDGHYSHTRNLDIIDIARKNYVTILSIPPYTTHKMQPLDRTFMEPFKQYYSEYIRIWQRENERPVGLYDIAELLGRAYLQCQTEENPTSPMSSTKQIIATTKRHDQQIEENFAQPSCSKDCKIEQITTSVSPKEI
ncbi:PREDICTED: tigger transposable element-derived protein 1-like isoform X2 [Trachymyrmex cornetzi]|uniref:tigger transposable element-derived protein 1-like isoform X2 n=1 Tax=Trachymyrmex cornetzi TaxID=471704 RepID=UPI00084F6CEC|nr:PREDICTED: tigger transposable element-derived protein 1-like isoform X2 [Trachymyrmex cornetzi]